MIYMVRNKDDAIFILKIICVCAIFNTAAGLVEFRLQHRFFIDIFPRGAWIPERSATCLREADLNVLSKLGNQGLEWRLEPEAFTRREVRREDDLLDVLVGCPVDIQVAWQPST